MFGFKTPPLCCSNDHYCWNNLLDSNCTAVNMCVIDKSSGAEPDFNDTTHGHVFLAHILLLAVVFISFVFNYTCMVQQIFAAVITKMCPPFIYNVLQQSENSYFDFHTICNLLIP